MQIEKIESNQDVRDLNIQGLLIANLINKIKINYATLT